MASTHTSLLYHLVFSTKNRDPVIDADWRPRLHEYLGGSVAGLGGVSLGVGGVADHVHILASLNATHCLSDFMRELKKASSAWVAETVPLPAFRWQEGYGAFTVSASLRETIQTYIARQEEHHRSRSFRDEYLLLLRKSGIEFNERYLD